ncbi:MAG TPA: sulfopyruvate decarboxylase subunit alpha [Candidatus Deferrimicrobium sp.]|nr:sulfopyruvate decarboxylase subunit alpha [Candidatus Deferrimicrobium sp.]
MNPEEQIIELLKKHRIGHIFSVPCAKIKNLLILCSQNFTHIPLTREEEGIGFATGIYLAGAFRSALLMQSGGIGNSINALISLAVIHKIPIPILISWRGIYKENIIAQNAIGQHITRIFEAMDIPYIEIHDEKNIPEIDHALQSCFEHETPYGILLNPKIWEKSTLQFPKLEFPPRKRVSEIHLIKNIQNPTLTRFEILQGLQPFLKGKIIVSNIGIPSQELYEVCDQSSNFYMTGSFGMVSLIGLGVAMKISEEVIVLDGDGSILTNPNALCTIAQIAPHNLTILAIDNGTHGSTGNQITQAYSQLDLEFIAHSFGIQTSGSAYTPEEILKLYESLGIGPRFIHIFTKPFNANVKIIPLTPVEIKERFMRWIKENNVLK